MGLLVFEGHQVVGAGALKLQSIPTHTQLRPWAAAGYVLPSHRGRGLGAFLLQGLVVKARSLGFARIYCGTSSANTLLERSGWHLMETTEHEGKSLGIYCSAT
ncbi:MAG: GNAT family N-acetyltransferase [Betaproteobacteria bacterium]|nr:GNAT family N-acetyltransferase [Betaproteobacteria bacterium]